MFRVLVLGAACSLNSSKLDVNMVHVCSHVYVCMYACIYVYIYIHMYYKYLCSQKRKRSDSLAACPGACVLGQRRPGPQGPELGQDLPNLVAQ